MKRRSQGRQKRAPSSYTKYRKTPHRYPDWIVRGDDPPRGSEAAKLQWLARIRREALA